MIGRRRGGEAWDLFVWRPVGPVIVECTERLTLQTCRAVPSTQLKLRCTAAVSGDLTYGAWGTPCRLEVPCYFSRPPVSSQASPVAVTPAGREYDEGYSRGGRSGARVTRGSLGRAGSEEQGTLRAQSVYTLSGPFTYQTWRLHGCGRGPAVSPTRVKQAASSCKMTEIPARARTRKWP